MDYELEPCRVCHEDCAYVEYESDWGVYVTCGVCGTQTACCSYDTPDGKDEAEKTAVHLWNMGKVIKEGRGE